MGFTPYVQILKKGELMKKILLTLLLASPLAWAEQDHANMHDHSHEGHLHDTMVDGKNLDVSAERFDAFMNELTNVNVAVVSVKGMVCDFCARGIAKTFEKDKDVYFKYNPQKQIKKTFKKTISSNNPFKILKDLNLN